MFPTVDGFQWSTGHLIFLGVFFAVVGVILVTFAASLWRTRRDRGAGRTEPIRWKSDFHDLPERDRVCRHEFTGEFLHRTCDSEFDCRGCLTHARLVEIRPPRAAEDEYPYGMHFPADRYYHRGHTWVFVEEDGTLSVGLDEFAARLFGPPDSVDLPAPGSHLRTNGPAWTMRRGNHQARVLSPMGGEVVATGGKDAGFYLKLRAPGAIDTRHLLRGSEIRLWLGREMEKLQFLLSPAATGPSLADGGLLVEDVPASQPKADWDAVFGEMFLEP